MKNMRKNLIYIYVLACSALIVPTNVIANSLDISISSDTLRIGGEFPRNNSASILNAGLSYQKNKGLLVNTGFLVVDLEPVQIVQKGIGAKVYITQFSDTGSYGLFGGLGGFLRAETQYGIGVEFDGFYAPEVLSVLKSAKSFYDFQLRATYRLMQQANLFVGYSQSRISFEQSYTQNVIDSSIIGIRMNF